MFRHDKSGLALLLKSKVLVVDGAMGTELLKKGYSNGCFEMLNITKPDLIGDIHAKYVASGADIIETNTFGASRIKLWDYDLQEKTAEINRAGVVIARKSAPNSIIAGVIGPLGELLEPAGSTDFSKAVSCFREQAEALREADILLLQTFFDIKELKAALIGAMEVFSGPIVASMTFSNGRTTTGTNVESFVCVAEAFDVFALGTNCSDGPEGMLETVKLLAKYSSKPLWAEPNAGIPEIKDGITRWVYPKKQFGVYARRFSEAGAGFIGGCCGTDSSFIAEIARNVRSAAPVKRETRRVSRVCSRTRTVVIEPTIIVGERINPTGSKEFQAELQKGKIDYVRKQALRQAAQGAGLLDVNVGMTGIDEKEMLVKAVNAVQKSCALPIVIDTTDIAALEEALKAAEGKPVINSVNGKTISTVLPLAKKYGASVIGLCLDEKGIPNTLHERVRIAERLMDAAMQLGISEDDVILDPLVLTVATNPDNEKIVLDAVLEFKKRGWKTIAGISNISYGLPNRKEANRKFFTKMSELGLDLAIVDPLNCVIMEDTDICSRQIHECKELPLLAQFYNAVLFGYEELIDELTKTALKQHTAPELNKVLVDALSEAGAKYQAKDFFLPDVLSCARSAKKAFAKIRPLRKDGAAKILFATVENDVHDIGKNIVIALLESNNYDVTDLGISVNAETIIEKARELAPDVIALSALMTTTVPEMEKVVAGLAKRGMDIPVMIGGAVVTENYAKSIGAGYSVDALFAVKKFEEIIRRHKKCRQLR